MNDFQFQTRLQPEPTNINTSDDSRSSVVDSVMIDNQADYERIFRGKQRLPRSPSHPTQSASAQSSAGFALQTPVTNEPTPVSITNTIQPKSPPPQVNQIHNQNVSNSFVWTG